MVTTFHYNNVFQPTVHHLSFTFVEWRPNGQDTEPLKSAHKASPQHTSVCGYPGCLCVREMAVPHPSAHFPIVLSTTCLRLYGLVI